MTKAPMLACLSKNQSLVTKGSRVLEKRVNETQVSKTVFSHLNFKSWVSINQLPNNPAQITWAWAFDPIEFNQYLVSSQL